jgi:transcriptional regulator with XRE-family HTH domain
MTTLDLPLQIDRVALKALRKAATLNQADVASAADISTRAYQMIETGETPNPGIITLGKVCDAIGIRIFQIVIEDRPELPGPPESPAL